MLKVTPDHLKSLTPQAFEQIVAQLLAARGFRNVVSLGGSGDEGIDLRAEWLEELPTGDSRMTVWAVQCKRYSSSLSQQQISDVLNAALEPPRDLLPARPDFFLIATSSSLSVNSRRLVDRANNDRAKYGCTFIVWDGELISTKLSHEPEIVERFFPSRPPPPASPAAYPLIRLSIVVDKLADRVVLTFLCDFDDTGPASTLARSELSEQAFTELLGDARGLTSQLVYSEFSPEKEDLLKSVGARVAKLIPDAVRAALFRYDDAYVRLASNGHDIPFELAYDEERDRFLGASLRIGRIQITDTVRPLATLPGPSVLLVGPGTPVNIPALPFVEREIQQLSAILAGGGIPVTILAGDQATRNNLARLLAGNDYQIIHFSGHGIADPALGNGVVLADGLLSFDEMLSRPVKGSMVFLSACGSGNQMNETSQHFFNHGVSAVLGFIGPVTDQAGVMIAVRFYEELQNGATLGDALRASRQYQKSRMPEDFSWVSLVLFGDPTSRFTAIIPRP